MAAARPNLPKKQQYITNMQTVEADIALGASRKIIHNRFTAYEDAKIFQDWAKSWSHIHKIQQVEIDSQPIAGTNNLIHIVRLTFDQFHTLVKLGKGPTATFLDKLIYEIPESNLDPQQKIDALKALMCFQYIRDNLDDIAAKIDRKDTDKSIYKIKPYTNKQGEQVAGDEEKGVLRDYNNSAFHIDGLKNGAEAKTYYSGVIKELEEDTLKALCQINKNYLIQFANKISFDIDTPCLAGRITRAQLWVFNILQLEAIPLDDILELSRRMRTEANEPIFEIAKKYCQENNLTFCALNNAKVEINDEMLLDYIKAVFPEEFEEEVETSLPPLPMTIATKAATPPDKNEEKAVAPRVTVDPDFVRSFMNFITKADRVMLGQAGMLQYHFSNQTIAQQFVTLLKTQTALKLLGIEKARAALVEKDKQKFFVVRLSCAQYKEIMGAYSFQEIIAALKPSKQPEEAKTVNESRQKLLAIRNDINNKSNWKCSMFGYMYETRKPPQTAEAILSIVAAAEQKTKTLPATDAKALNLWNQSANNVKQLLFAATQPSAQNGSPDTVAFYKTEYKNYFSP